MFEQLLRATVHPIEQFKRVKCVDIIGKHTIILQDSTLYAFNKRRTVSILAEEVKTYYKQHIVFDDGHIGQIVEKDMLVVHGGSYYEDRIDGDTKLRFYPVEGRLIVKIANSPDVTLDHVRDFICIYITFGLTLWLLGDDGVVSVHYLHFDEGYKLVQQLPGVYCRINHNGDSLASLLHLTAIDGSLFTVQPNTRRDDFQIKRITTTRLPIRVANLRTFVGINGELYSMKESPLMCSRYHYRGVSSVIDREQIIIVASTFHQLSVVV